MRNPNRIAPDNQTIYEHIAKAKQLFLDHFTATTGFPCKRVYTSVGRGRFVDGKVLIHLTAEDAVNITTAELDKFEEVVWAAGFTLGYRLTNKQGKAYTKPRVTVNC